MLYCFLLTETNEMVCSPLPQVVNKMTMFYFVFSILVGFMDINIPDGIQRDPMRDFASSPKTQKTQLNSVLYFKAKISCGHNSLKCQVWPCVLMYFYVLCVFASILRGSYYIAASQCIYVFSILNVFNAFFAPTYWNQCHSSHRHYHIVSECLIDHCPIHVLCCPCCPTLASIPNFYSLVPP